MVPEEGSVRMPGGHRDAGGSDAEDRKRERAWGVVYNSVPIWYIQGVGSELVDFSIPPFSSKANEIIL